MIRRNYIETGSKIDRQALKIRSRQPREESNSSKYQSNKYNGDVPRDQNMWMGNSNKKYQQYKIERQQRPKIQEFKVELKPYTLPLSNLESKQNEYHYKQDNLLKRQYAYDLGDTLKIDYNSISLKPNRFNHHHQKNQPSKIQQNYQQKTNHNNFDQTVALSPSKNYSLPKKYTPLFQQNDYILNLKKLSDQNHIKIQTETDIYSRPTQIAKKNNEHRRFYSKAKQNCQENNQIIQNSNKSHFSSVIEKQSAPRCAFNAPTLPPSYQKQEVSQKLRMISDFNDQINERIKNIIGCFQGLKNKL